MLRHNFLRSRYPNFSLQIIHCNKEQQNYILSTVQNKIYFNKNEQKHDVSIRNLVH